MKVRLLSILLMLAGCACADRDESYDYSASIDCLSEPWAPQYGGGLFTNPKFDLGLDKWSLYSAGKIELRVSNTSGNKYMVAYRRSRPFDSFARVLHLQKELLYTFSAWVRINSGKEIVSAILETSDARKVYVGSVIAKSGCWSMLKGGFSVDQDMTARLFFKSKNTEIELWLDNVSLKAFTRKEWHNQQNQTTDKVRKKKVRIHVTDEKGRNVTGAKITINESKPSFKIGCGTTEAIINNRAYQNWFSSRFTAATFNNEMKWYFTERQEGKENYTIPDAMVEFFKNHGISIRGHTILWASKHMTQTWVQKLSHGEKALPHRDILKAAVRRTGSMVSRYSDKVIAWDVMNENMHNSFYENEIGPNASAMFYQITRALDSETTLFLNEYNVLECPNDLKVIPSAYVEKIREIRSFPGNENMEIGIGVQGHFIQRPNVSHIRAALDVLGATKMPIWFTELDTKRGPDQAVQLEDVMREAFSHPAVQGIIVWAGWKPTNCKETCLLDKNFDVLPTGCAQLCLIDEHVNVLPTGEVVDKLIKEWRTSNLTGITDGNGIFESNVFKGEYSLTISHPRILSVVKKRISVTGEKPGTLELSFSLRQFGFFLI